MRRGENEGWKTARKVFRSKLLQARYDNLRSKLTSLKEPDIFRGVKPWEGKQSLPLMRRPDGTTAFKHDEVSHMIAA